MCKFLQLDHYYTEFVTYNLKCNCVAPALSHWHGYSEEITICV